MKSLLITLGLLSSGLALAQTPPQPPVARPVPSDVRQGLHDDATRFNKMNFEDHKAHMLKRMAEQAQNLKKEADCVGQAKTPEDMHACREEAHKLRREVREHFMKQQRQMDEHPANRHDSGQRAPGLEGNPPPLPEGKLKRSPAGEPGAPAPEGKAHAPARN